MKKEHFTFHLQNKHSGTFTNYKYEELSYHKNQKTCDPILVTLLKMRPHDSQSSRENATPFSGTSSVASYKEVPPPPPPGPRSLVIFMVPIDTYILLDVLLCSIAEYFYELCRILASP